jgi:HK97 family phage major capsid protein
MTIEQLRAALEAAQTELHERNASLTEARTAIDSADESADLEELRTSHDTAASAVDEQIDEVNRVKRNLEDAKRRDKALRDNPRPVREAAAGRISTVEPPVYAERSETSFFADAYRHQFNHDTDARERLERHGRQQHDLFRERGLQLRDVGTGAFAGLTIPQYLIDLYAPLARAGAPLLAAIPRKLQLPATGMVLDLSTITTGSAVAAQATENSGVQETDIDDTLLTVNVRTYAGQQDVSRQALERSEMVDTVVFADLVMDYFTKLDAALISGAGTSGTHKGITASSGIISKTYTDGSPTLPELYPKVADAIQAIASQLYRPATTIFMHPRRWGWATAALDSSNRPLVVPDAQGPFNALAVGDAPEYGAVVGTMQGLPVITDANITSTNGASTNEDQILVERLVELLFWQEADGNPRQFRFEQTNAPQSVRLAVWGYSAFTAERYPTGNAVISGTGLATPSF